MLIWGIIMYELPKLSYSFQELEPYIDTHTMGLHYHRHEQNYLNKLNDLLMENDYDYRYGIDELLAHLNEFPNSVRDDILFNLGGVLNHNLYWKGISQKSGQMPQGKLMHDIEKTFGSYKQFWIQLKGKALQLKGSGYTFLVINNGQLDIINFYNQDLPLYFGYIPLFNIDMWEHAYYLNYENDKMRYLDNFERIADFTNASEIYNSIVA